MSDGSRNTAEQVRFERSLTAGPEHDQSRIEGLGHIEDPSPLVTARPFEMRRCIKADLRGKRTALVQDPPRPLELKLLEFKRREPGYPGVAERFSPQRHGFSPHMQEHDRPRCLPGRDDLECVLRAL